MPVRPRLGEGSGPGGDTAPAWYRHPEKREKAPLLTAGELLLVRKTFALAQFGHAMGWGIVGIGRCRVYLSY